MFILKNRIWISYFAVVVSFLVGEVHAEARSNLFVPSNCETSQIMDKGSIQIINSEEVQVDQLFFDRHSPRECFENGKISYGSLSRDAQIQGTQIRRGSFVLFFITDGNLKYAEIPYHIQIQGMRFAENSLFHFYAEKDKSMSEFKNKLQIEGAFSSQPIRVEGVPCRSFVSAQYKIFFPIHFYNTGNLSSCFLSESKAFNQIGFHENFWIHFYDSTEPMQKKVKLGELIEPTFVQGVPCDSRSVLLPGAPRDAYAFPSIFFHPNGVLGGAILSKDFTINGMSYPKGSILCFSPTGQFLAQKALLWDCLNE